MSTPLIFFRCVGVSSACIEGCGSLCHLRNYFDLFFFSWGLRQTAEFHVRIWHHRKGVKRVKDQTAFFAPVVDDIVWPCISWSFRYKRFLYMYNDQISQLYVISIVCFYQINYLIQGFMIFNSLFSKSKMIGTFCAQRVSKPPRITRRASKYMFLFDNNESIIWCYQIDFMNLRYLNKHSQIAKW